MQHLKFFPVICFLPQGQFVGSTGTESKKHHISNITWFFFKTGRKFCDLQAISYSKSGTTFSRKGAKKQKTSFNRAKKVLFVLTKGTHQECPGASLDTCSLTCICVEGRWQQLNILKMLNTRMDTKLTGGPTSTNRMWITTRGACLDPLGPTGIISLRFHFFPVHAASLRCSWEAHFIYIYFQMVF